MKNKIADSIVQHLKALAAHKIADQTRSRYVIITEPETDKLQSGEAIFLFHGYEASNPNGKTYQVIYNSSGTELNREELEKSEKRPLFSHPLPIVRPELLLPFGVATADITISPKENHLTLKECEQFDEVITVIVPKDSRRKIDIYFLADTTGSMTEILDAVKTGASSILAAIDATGNDLAYGVGNYRDEIDGPPYPFQHQLNPTSSTVAVTAAINTWTADGGGDAPEAQLAALDQLAQAPGGSIGWRTDAKRIIVWFGDQPGHDPSAGAMLPSIIAKLQAENISVIAISVGANLLDSTGQAMAITSATGGSFQSGINASNIVNTIITLINSLVSVINNLSLVAAGSTAPFVTFISPSGGYGPLKGDSEHVLTFKVTFTGVRPCNDVDRVFTGSLNVVADGTVVTHKTVKIHVPACCKKRRYSYSVKYVIGRQDPQDCNSKLAVNAGNYTTEINIHNYQQKKALIEKFLVPVIFEGKPIGREPEQTGILANDNIVLGALSATMDDTFRLSQLLYKNDPPCGILMHIGFLHIISNIKLAVTAVYTAANGKEGLGTALEVKEITERELPLEDRRTHD